MVRPPLVISALRRTCDCSRINECGLAIHVRRRSVSEYPRGTRGVAATRLSGLRVASTPRRRHVAACGRDDDDDAMTNESATTSARSRVNAMTPQHATKTQRALSRNEDDAATESVRFRSRPSYARRPKNEHDWSIADSRDGSATTRFDAGTSDYRTRCRPA